MSYASRRHEHPIRAKRVLARWAWIAWGGAVLLSGCGGDSVTSPRKVAEVRVRPEEPSAEVGDTLQFLAEAYDAAGRVVPARPVRWHSGTPTVATAEADGRVIAVGPGASVIRATIDGVDGVEVLVVSRRPCAGGVDLSLQPGQHRALEAGTCIVLPTGSGGETYRVAAVRPSAEVDPTDVRTSVLTTRLRGPVPAPPDPRRVGGTAGRDRFRPIPLTRALASSVRRQEATAAFHTQLRRQERGLWRSLRVDPRPDGLPSRSAHAPSPPPATLRVDPTTPSNCVADPAAVTTGLLLDHDDYLAVYQDSAQHAEAPVGASSVRRLIDYYASYVREMIEAYWGTPSDLDENGRIVVFLTPAVPSSVSAFVWAGDLVEKVICEASNEMEVVFLNAALLRSMEEPAEPSYDALETLAHEVKHIVSLRHRLLRSQRMESDQFHPPWIEEGTAEVSAEKSSRIAWAAVGGPPVGARITGRELERAIDERGGVPPEAWGLAVRLVRTRQHLTSHPNSITGEAHGAGPGHSPYSGGWIFHNWLADAYGDAATPFADAPFFLALTDSTAPAGVAGITAVTGSSFPVLFENFAVAVGLVGIDVPQPAFAFTTTDFPSATAVPLGDDRSGAEGSFPWPVTSGAGATAASFQTATWSGPMGTGGLRYHDFVSSGSADMEVELELPGGGLMIVMRIR